jgi:hypothetical protein
VHLTIVDLTERCIEHCRDKFSAYPHLECWTNDGQSLDMIEDETLDFVFSFDSLVHAEAPVLRAYLAQLATKLKPGGVGFIHHSNLASLAQPDGTTPSWVARRNWRGESMSTRLFREYCRESGLHCRTQEIINWVSRSTRADRHRIPGWGMPMTDALSTFSRPARDERAATRVYVNARFVEEWRQLMDLAAIYGRVAAHRDTDARVQKATVTARVSRALRANGVAGVADRLREKVSERTEDVASLLRERRLARRVRRNEPILGNLRRGRCPDCRGPLHGRSCPPCHVDYLF